MVRIGSLVLAVVLGLAAVALLTTSSTVTFGVESRSCGGPVVGAETAWLDDSPAANPIDRGLDRACAHRLRWQAAGAGLAAVLCAVAVAFAHGERERSSALV